MFESVCILDRANKLLTVLSVVLAVVYVSTSQADVVIIDDGTVQLRGNQANQSYGYDFTVGISDLTVTALGVWDDDAIDVISTTNGQTGGTPDGLAGTVTVRLWDHTNPSTSLATVVISGIEGYLVGEFRFKEIASPVVLNAGGTYQLTAHYASTGDILHHYKDPADFIYTWDVGDFVARYCLNNTQDQFATGYGGTNVTLATDKAFIGPNLQYSIEGGSILINPSPSNLDEGVNLQPTFGWDILNAVSPEFEIYIAADENFNNVLVSQNTGADNFYTPDPNLLSCETTYYWRVDVTDGLDIYSGSTWSFATGGKAYDPVPPDMGTLESKQVTLNWAGYDWVGSYDVYFGLPGAMVFVDNYSVTMVGIGDLAASLGVSALSPDIYQWRVDSRDNSGGLFCTGDEWTVNMPEDYEGHLVIDDFDDYVTTANLLGSWSDGTTNGTGSVIAEAMMGMMKLEYNNASAPQYSEVARIFGTIQDWDISDSQVLALSLRGDTGNTPDGFYLIIDDGTTPLQLTYPGFDILITDHWQEWYIHRDDLVQAGLDLSHITGLTIGIGDGLVAGSGTVYIDDIKIYLSKCVSDFILPGDLNSDCDVDILDMGLLAESWLMQDYSVTPVQPNSANLVVDYVFDESSGSTAGDSVGTNDATVIAADPDTQWSPTGGYKQGCLTMGDDVMLAIPGSVWDEITGSMTIAFWINGALADYPDRVNQMFVKYPTDASNEYIWSSAVWNIDPADSYDGWNHLALTIDTAVGLVRLFHNGQIVAECADTNAMSGSGTSMDTIMRSAGIIDGLGGPILLDELRIYDVALSAEEVACLAVGASGSLTQAISPVFTLADMNGDGAVTLLDYAKIASFWLD